MLSSKLSPERWTRIAMAGVVALAMGVLFHKTFQYLVFKWHMEEYSHGWLIPPITAYLLWRRRKLLVGLSRHGAWMGFALVVLGLLLFFLTFFLTIVGADAYALMIVIVGLALATLGWQGFKVALVPIALLFLAIPLPQFWYFNLSSELQLISSQLGVAIMRIFGVSVFLQGNVIDLGDYKLQVAEACSGLRYLFPLMTLGALIAYLFHGRTWMRWVLFVSTVPITVIMNSVRIGAIGVLVDRFGIAQAEGFLHDFEGWAIFMVCFFVLLVEGRVLLWVSGDRRPMRQVLGFDGTASLATASRLTPGGRGGRGSLPAFASAIALMLAVYPAQALPQRTEIRPDRRDFSLFKPQIGDWVGGGHQRIESEYLDQLQLDDYLLADFTPKGRLAAVSGMNTPVNLYVAYYASQRTGQAVHSPSSCLPGGGWRIEQFEQRDVPGVLLHTGPLRVNRAVMRQGLQRMLVYYWFQERGRDITSEYLVKWYLLVDALARQRTDGALVRLITPMREGENPAAGDARLERFSVDAVPELRGYLPE
jgi:exosortase D (VPLPA-CTERM-specific)